MGTLSQGVTLRYLKWKEGECFLPAFAHQAPGLPDFTRSTPSQRHWLTALRVWGHCSICTSLVSCLEWLLFSFPDKEMEAGWHWWRWTTGYQTPSPVSHTHTPHPVTKMSDTNICSGESKGDLTKSMWVWLDFHSLLPAAGTGTSEPGPQLPFLPLTFSVVAGLHASEGGV